MSISIESLISVQKQLFWIVFVLFAVKIIKIMNQPKNKHYSRTDKEKLNVSNTEWEEILDPEVYRIAREAGTERPFTGEFWDTDKKGEYYCKICGNHLFKSDMKFSSSCGWPSFFETIHDSSVIYQPDPSHGMNRVEVLCGRCDSHLGHIFDDGPAPTYKRFCMNSAVLDFEAEH